MADGSTNDDPEDYRRVYRAVAAGESAESVRRAIEACAQGGSDERRAAAANKAGEHEGKIETPLQAAHRLRRGDLVGVLLEAGCDVDVQLPFDRCTSALVLCIAYGQADSLRALLRSGHVDARAPIAFHHGTYRTVSDSDPEYSKQAPVHLCMQPPWLGTGFSSSPQLACLEVLVREGGADVNARDRWGKTPLHHLCSEHRDYVTPLERSDGVDFLVRLGAEVNARDELGATPLFDLAAGGDPPALHRLLAHGASVDVTDDEGKTPLIWACMRLAPDTTPDYDLLYEVLRLSSEQTRRVVSRYEGGSAVDYAIGARNGWPLQPSHKQVIAELLSYGVPVLPENAYHVLPIAVSLGLPLAAQKEAALAARLSAPISWRAHDAAVGLALDARDAREAEEEVELLQRRVEALEEGLGAETDGGSEGESEGEGEGGGGSTGSSEGGERGGGGAAFE